MADDPQVTPPATPPPADEGFLHSLATSLGLDPEAVKAAGKSLWAHPIQTAEAVGSEAATEAADAVKNAKQTLTDTAKGVGAGLGVDPAAQATAAARFKSPGVLNKIAGGLEYVGSGVPLVGSGLAKSQEQAASGNARGSMGTLLGTIAPALLGTEGAEDIKAHLADTARTAVEGAKEEVTNAVNAKAPEGSTEAGTIKLSNKNKPILTSEGASPRPEMSNNNGWLDEDGKFHPLLDGESHPAGQRRLALGGTNAIRVSAGPNFVIFTPEKNIPEVRQNLISAIQNHPQFKTVEIDFADGKNNNYQHLPADQAVEWLENGARPGPQIKGLISFEQLGGKEVLSAEDRGDLLTQERQSQLKEPYKVEIANTMTGDRRVEPIDAFSAKDAIRTAQKKFPDANQYTISEFGERTPNPQYSVPTQEILSMPQGDTPRRTYVSTIRHELGHALVGQNDGLALKGMLRHTHVDAPGTMRAGVLWDGRSIMQNGRVAPEKVAPVIRSLMGGIAADEAFNDVPRVANHNFDIRASGGDANKAYLMLKAAGYDHDAAMDMIHTAVDQGKEYLTHPAVSGIIKENEAVREPGLSRQYHYSAERLQNMHQEVQRRINATGTAEPNNGTVGAENTGERPENVAGGESKTTPASGQGVQGGLFTPELKKQDEGSAPAVLDKIASNFGTSTNAVNAKAPEGSTEAGAVKIKAAPETNVPSREGGSAQAPGQKDQEKLTTQDIKKNQSIRAYHGTAATTNFENFSLEGRQVDEKTGEPLTSGSGADPTAYLGVHFAAEPAIANKFAMRSVDWMKSRYESGEGEPGAAGPRVIPVDLTFKKVMNFGSESNMRNTIYAGDLTNAGYAGDTLLNAAMKADGVDYPEDGGEDTEKWIEKYTKNLDFRRQQNEWIFENYRPEEGEDDIMHEGAAELANQARSQLTDAGYDGASYNNEVEGGKSYVAFHPNTISSPFKEEITNAINAKAPEGSPEAGAVKINKKTEREWTPPERTPQTSGQSVQTTNEVTKPAADDEQDIYTRPGAQALADHIGGRVVGSVSVKGASTHDLDLAVDTYDQQKIEAAMKAKGFEPIGSSVVSPAEAKKSGRDFGGTDSTDWNRAHHFESNTARDASGPRRQVDIWSKEPAETPEKVPFTGTHYPAGKSKTSALDLIKMLGNLKKPAK